MEHPREGHARRRGVDLARGHDELRQLLLALGRLHVPPILVQIASFMLRYVTVILGEMHRMKVARESRGGRDIRDVAVVARSAGAMFIRSYERGASISRC